jgi:predicted phage terminase large subunit-like protein
VSTAFAFDGDDEKESLKPVKIRIKIHDDGPALWPERFTAKKLRQIAKTLGSYNFSSLYQGSPAPEGGGLFKKSWFRYYSLIDGFLRLENRTFKLEHCRRFGTCDLAFSVKTSADRTAIAAWAVTPDWDLVLLDMHLDRMTGDQLVPSCRSMVEKWDLAYMGIEDVAAQTLVVQTARRNGLTVRPLKANMDKITRSMPAQIRMEAGQIWFPKQHSTLESLEHELLTFPQGAHDDTVDVLAYAALEVQRHGVPSIPPEEQARLAREKAEREWNAKIERDKAAQADYEHPRWWQDAWSGDGHDAD